MVDATHREVSAQRTMVSLRRAAELLGISTATVRNWTRSGLLEPADMRRPMKVWRDEVFGFNLSSSTPPPDGFRAEQTRLRAVQTEYRESVFRPDDLG